MFNKTKVWTLASLVLLGGGAIVSCSDNDDDIKRNETAISNLTTQLSALQAALDQAKSDAQTAHASFVTQTELKNVEAAAKAAAQEAAATAKAEALTEAINQCKALIAGKADQSALDALSNRVNSIDATLNKLGDMASKSDLDAAKKNLQDQINALNYLKQILPEGTDFQQVLRALATLKAELEAAQKELDGMKAEDVSGLKNTMTTLQNKVNAFSSEINVLTVLINKMLTSVTLVPTLYEDGIETISFDYLAYYPVKDNTSGYVREPNTQLQRIDKGQTEIKYRLNPSTVKLTSIDVDNIAFVGHQAEKRDPSRAAAETPIFFQSVKSYENGELIVTAKRNPNVDITAGYPKNVWVAAIKVPRKADEVNQVEYAEIYSEYSMVKETTFTPQIAEVDLSKSSDLKYNATTKTYYFGTDNPVIKEALAGANQPDGWSATEYHYFDRDAIYGSLVDADPLDHVTIEVPFNYNFDLLQLVTGCKTRDMEGYGSTTADKADREKSTHYWVSREELASYGLEYRFSVPTEEYFENADNKTNQQEFAVLDGSIVKSTTPDGKVQNEAVIGKEPIIKVQLIDTKSDKKYIVDERYFKIKWAPLAPEEDKPLPPKHLKDKKSEIELKPCDDMIIPGVTWREFIDEVYAQLGDNGMSQADFDINYPEEKRVVTAKNWQLYDGTTLKASQAYTGDVPEIGLTTNEHGDALIANWTLTPEDVQRVIWDNLDPAKAMDDHKVITTTLTFNPKDKTLPVLYFDWIVDITVPKLPTLAGYYDQYWFEKYNTVDVLPVQYGTPAQKSGNYLNATSGNTGTPGYEKCVYDFNLTNAFVYNIVNGQVKYVVKDMYPCGSYDIQFRKDQVTGWTSPNPASDWTNQWTNNREPKPETEIWNEFAAYKLYKSAEQALQMYWVEVSTVDNPELMSTPVAYKSWDITNSNWRSAKIFASSANKKGLSGLLNPLSTENEVSPSGQIQPVFTHEKKVNMGIWSRLNDYNYILVKGYDLCLVAPLRINFYEGKGALEDGYVDGCPPIAFNDIFSMTDFRGYLVAENPSQAIIDKYAKDYSEEQAGYADELYSYYEVEGIDIAWQDITFNLKFDAAGNMVVDNSMQTWKTSNQIRTATNGNVVISVQQKGDGLSFYNNGGSNLEEKCYAKIPCTVKYGFGEASTSILIPINPHK